MKTFGIAGLIPSNLLSRCDVTYETNNLGFKSYRLDTLAVYQRNGVLK